MMIGLGATSTATRVVVLILGAGAAASLGYALWQAQQAEAPPPDPAPAVVSEAAAPSAPDTAPVAAIAEPTDAPDAAPDEAQLGAAEETHLVDTPASDASAPPEEAAAALDLAPAESPDLAPVILTWAVTRDGSATIAGKAAPGAELRILVNGEDITQTKVTRSGEFAVVTRLKPNPNPSLLTLVARLETGEELPSSTAVALGPILGEELRVASREAPADTPEVVATQSEAPADEASAPVALLLSENAAVALANPSAPSTLGAGVFVETVSYSADGEVVLGGRATPEHYLRFYFDGVMQHEARVPSSGQWQFELSGIAPGRYQLRVDELTGEGEVSGRVELPFLRETREALALAAAAPAALVPDDAEPIEVDPAPVVLAASDPAADSLPLTQASSEVLPELGAAPEAKAAEAEALPQASPAPVTVTVQPGHTLWAIARGELGGGTLYVQVFEANRDKIRDPDLIYPGQVFTIPGR